MRNLNTLSKDGLSVGHPGAHEALGEKWKHSALTPGRARNSRTRQNSPERPGCQPPFLAQLLEQAQSGLCTSIHLSYSTVTMNEGHPCRKNPVKKKDTRDLGTWGSPCGTDTPPIPSHSTVAMRGENLANNPLNSNNYQGRMRAPNMANYMEICPSSIDDL